MSEKTEGVGSGPKGNGAGIDPTAVALATACTGCERVDAFLKDQQEPIAAQLHPLAVNQSYQALAKFAEAEKRAPDWSRLHSNRPGRSNA